jgi:4-amino-4-deoxy-L-arabinose transferase-like glycosyltransferase
MRGSPTEATQLATQSPATGLGQPRGGLPLTTRVEWLLLLLVMCLAGALRTVQLTGRGLNLDEGFSVFLGQTSAANFGGLIWRSELNMALYYAALRLWMQLGHSEFALRLLSVLLATATVPVVYFLGRRLFDSRTGLIAALLLAFHPFHFTLAQSARSYALVIFMVCLASLFFVRGLSRPAADNWVAYAVFAAAAVYHHFFALLVIVAHGVSLLFLPRPAVPWKWLAVAACMLALLLLPVAVFLLHHRDAANVAWVGALSLEQARDVLYSLTLSKFRWLAYAVAWLLAGWYSFHRPDGQSAWPFWFTTCWLVVPIAVTVAGSFLQPILVERYLAVCIPAVVLLAADGIASVAQRQRIVATGLLLLILFFSASNIRFYVRHAEFDENWREATAFVVLGAHPGDEVVIMDGLPHVVFDHYRQTSPTGLNLIIVGSADAPIPSPLPENVWFMGSTRLKPDWEGEAHRFLELHRQDYCYVAPTPVAGPIKVWQFRRCGPEAGMPRPGR